MAKTKTTFFCQNCGAQHTQWVGQCGSCKQWNTIVEEVIQKEEKRNWKSPSSSQKRVAKPLRVEDIQLNPERGRVGGGGRCQEGSSANGGRLPGDDAAQLPRLDCLLPFTGRLSGGAHQ